MTITSKIKHSFHCAILLTTILVVQYVSTPSGDFTNQDCGVLISLILAIQKFFILGSFPLAVMMFLGLVCYNAFPDEIKVKGTSPPFVCVRTVTRGLFPELVHESVKRNMKTCTDNGLKNYRMEVVTDCAIGLPFRPGLTEIVVPPEYKTKNGTLFKARALQYCLEEKVNTLDDQDWVVHLDEETIMTPGSVRGILNFICDGKHELGQGAITYANEKVVNWLTTLLDAGRLAEDLGVLRFQLKTLHRPYIGWKGSFMVIKAGLEKIITFDHGPRSSVTEDINFALLAISQGYSFNFVEGVMWEKSAFTLGDYIRQRGRWCQGCILISLKRDVPFRAKFLMCYFTILNLLFPIAIPALLLNLFYPMTWDTSVCLMRSFTIGTLTYSFPFGVLGSFNLTKLGPLKFAFFILAAFLVAPFIKMVLEYVAVVRCLLSRKVEFYIVDKHIPSASQFEMTV